MTTTALEIKRDETVFRLEFSKTLDRFAHQIVQVEDQSESVILESVEGSAEQIWPSSPPLQDISIEPINGENAALLVGMAGTSHWSMSVTNSISPEGDIGWEFDVACRLKQNPSWMGNTYSVFEADQAKFKILSKSDVEFYLEAKENLAQELVCVRCNFLKIETSRTLQWKYAIYLPEISSK